MTQKKIVTHWMIQNLNEYRNSIQLAENCADEFDIYIGDFLKIPDWLYKLAEIIFSEKE